MRSLYALICTIASVALIGTPGGAYGFAVYPVQIDGANCIMISAAIDSVDLASGPFVSIDLQIEVTGSLDPFFQARVVNLYRAALSATGGLVLGDVVGQYFVPGDGRVRLDLSPSLAEGATGPCVTAVLGALERTDGTIEVSLADDKSLVATMFVGGQGATSASASAPDGPSAAGVPELQMGGIECNPNPAQADLDISFSVTSKRSENGRVGVFDIRGRLVRSIPFEGGGKIGLKWDGRNRGGARVACGLYILVAYGGDGAPLGRQKVTIIR